MKNVLQSPVHLLKNDYMVNKLLKKYFRKNIPYLSTESSLNANNNVSSERITPVN